MTCSKHLWPADFASPVARWFCMHWGVPVTHMRPCPGLMQIQKVQTKGGGRVLVVPRPKNVPRPSGNLNVSGA